MKINDVEVSDEQVLALLTDEQKAKLTKAKGETDFILYKPETDECYLYVEERDGEIITAYWDDEKWEERLWSVGYIAPDTPEGLRYLERKRDQHLAKVRLQRWIAANTTEKVDWGDETQNKYVPILDMVSRKIVLNYYTSWMVNPDSIYVTKADRDRFLAECENDLKVYFGVK